MNTKTKLVEKFFNPPYCSSTRVDDHRTYGGLITLSDFCTDHNGRPKSESSYASRIISDWRFDEMCRKNIAQRENKNNTDI